MNVVRRLVTVVVLAALFAPVALDRDSYPLSTYPMYSRTRSTTISYVVATGVAADGSRARLDLELVGASDDPLIVSALTRAAAAGGPDAVARLCEQIADRVAAAGRQDVAVEVARETHDTVRRTAGEDSLVTVDVLGACEVRT